MTDFATLKQYLDWSANLGDPIAKLAFEFGRRWKNAELPHDVKEGQPNRCYPQARALALAQPERFTYVEGYAFHQVPVPIHHAWCVDEYGNVADPTWVYAEQALYCGIAFAYDALHEKIITFDEWGFFRTPGLPEKIIASPERFLVSLDSHQWGAPTLSLDVVINGLTLSPM